MGKDASNFSGLRALKFFGYSISPLFMKLFKITIFSKKANIFFRGLIKETLRREKVGLKTRSNLILQIQDLQLSRSRGQEKQKRDKSHRYITDEDITAQALLFFLGGFDTVSTLMCHASYELAFNPEIQTKLRDAVDATSKTCKGQITYEALLGMKYLDNVVSETLRKWPVSPVLDRCSTKPFTIEPVLSGEKPLYLEEGTICWIPVCAIVLES